MGVKEAVDAVAAPPHREVDDDASDLAAPAGDDAPAAEGDVTKDEQPPPHPPRHWLREKNALLGVAVGGSLAVHVGKRVIRRVPVVGPVFNALVSPFIPTILVGPIVGLAIALHL
eukprot:jgi/Chlat1/8755/Chrsp9S08573